MTTKIGIFSLAAGLFMAIFAGISGLMAANNFWVDLTISKLIGEDTTESIITCTDIIVIQDTLDSFMYEWPVFGLLLGLGAVLLIIGLFLKNH